MLFKVAYGLKYSRVGLLLWLCLGIPLQGTQGHKFRSDDPILEDPDREPVPAPNAARLSQIYDFVENSFITRPRKDPILAAENTNTREKYPTQAGLRTG